MIVELLLAERNHVCSVCVANGNCELQSMAYSLGVTHVRFDYLAPDLPVASNIVASLSRPGGYVTGFSTIVNELQGKRLELIRELMHEMGANPQANEDPD